MPADQRARVLVIQIQRLGDALLSAALLPDIREALPSAIIDFVTGPPAAELIRGNPYLTELITYDFARPIGMLREIRARRYSKVFDFQSNARTALLALASGAKMRVGWRIGLRGIAYTHGQPRAQLRDEYVVRARQRFLEVAGMSVRPRVPEIFLSAAEREQGRRDVLSIPTTSGAPRIGLVLGARAVGSRWPMERFAELAERLAADGFAPVILPTAGDEERAERCLELAPSAKRGDFPGLRQFVAAISAFDLLVSGDSGPAHMAMAVGTPTVTLYGSAHASRWNPGLPTSVAVNSARRSCTACARGAPRMAPSHTCMLEIDVMEVFTQVRALCAATAGQSRLEGAAP